MPEQDFDLRSVELVAAELVAAEVVPDDFQSLLWLLDRRRYSVVLVEVVAAEEGAAEVVPDGWMELERSAFGSPVNIDSVPSREKSEWDFVLPG